MALICVVVFTNAICLPYAPSSASQIALAQPYPYVDEDDSSSPGPFKISTASTVAPLAILAIQGVFNPSQPVSVRFSYQGKTVSMPAMSVSASTVQVVVPPLKGFVKVKVMQGNTHSQAAKVRILPLPTSNEAAGTVTVDYLNAQANDPNTPQDEQALIANVLQTVEQAMSGTKVQIGTRKNKAMYLTSDSLILVDGIILAEQQEEQAIASQSQIEMNALGKSIGSLVNLVTYFFAALVAIQLAEVFAVSLLTIGVAAVAFVAFVYGLVTIAAAVGKLASDIQGALNGEPGLKTTVCQNLAAAIAAVLTAPLKGVFEGLGLILEPKYEEMASFFLNQISSLQSFCSEPTPTPTATRTPTQTPTATATATDSPQPTATATSTTFTFSYTSQPLESKGDPLFCSTSSVTLTASGTFRIDPDGGERFLAGTIVAADVSGPLSYPGSFIGINNDEQVTNWLLGSTAPPDLCGTPTIVSQPAQDSVIDCQNPFPGVWESCDYFSSGSGTWTITP